MSKRRKIFLKTLKIVKISLKNGEMCKNRQKRQKTAKKYENGQ